MYLIYQQITYTFYLFLYKESSVSTPYIIFLTVPCIDVCAYMIIGEYK